jgi:hypothetical protein
MGKLIRLHDFKRHGLPRSKGLSLEWQRAGQIREAVEAYWLRHNPTNPLVWNSADEAATRYLIRMTRLCGLDYEQLVKNREQAAGIDHSKRPAKWLRNLGSYARSPSPPAPRVHETPQLT